VKNTGTKPLQNTAQDAQDATTHVEKKQKNPPKPTAMGASKVLAALDGLKKESEANKARDETAPGDAASTGRQRGAKNYSPPELRLLISCVEESVGVAGGFFGAAELYNRIAKERGWATRGIKALSQRWDKVRKTYVDITKY